jgi:ribosomal protein S6--L-glutamate ligase
LPGTIVSFHPSLRADVNRLLFSQRPLNQGDRRQVARAAAVLLPQVCRPDLHDLVQELGKPHFPRPRAHLTHDGKVGNFRLFRKLGLPHPRTLEFPGLEQAAACWEAGGLARAGLAPPLTAKGAGGGMGDNVFLVHDPDQLRGLGGRLETACARGPSGLVLQEFVDTGGRDVRAVLVGAWRDAFWRVGRPGEFRSNLSQGGRVERPAGDPGLERSLALARRLQGLAGLDLAAVDILVSPQAGPLLLEINFYFGREALGGRRAFAGIYRAQVRSWLAGLGLDPQRVRWED